MTLSEKRFERFCERRSIAYSRVAEGTGKTPEYEIMCGGMMIAVEVKQLEPNADDRRVLGQAGRGEPAGYWVDMSRARQSILNGTKQLRAYAKGRQPGLVVLYELVELLGYLDADSIAQCMYGPEQIHIAVPHDPKAEPLVLGAGYGGGRVTTERHNTTLSGVGVLRSTDRDDSLTIYHNRFAEIPLDPKRFRCEGVRHFDWLAPDAAHLPRWVEVT